MNIEAGIEMFRFTVTHALLLVAPILATTMVVGLIVSMIQAVTSIHEQTLTFVPKLIAVAAVMLVSAHWLMRTLMEFTVSVVNRFPEITR